MIWITEHPKYSERIANQLGNDLITSFPTNQYWNRNKCLRNRNLFFEKHQIHKNELTCFICVLNMCGWKSSTMNQPLKSRDLESFLKVDVSRTIKPVLCPQKHPNLAMKLELFESVNFNQIIKMIRESQIQNLLIASNLPEFEIVIQIEESK